MSWEKVFFAYECVLGRTDYPGALSIVAPDVIGDQSATLDLWAVHAERVRTWITAGARVIIPLQCGELSAGEMLAHAKRIFQTDQFCAGIPSNLAAMSAEDCATLHHHDFHLLGRVVINAELGDKLRALLANNPGAIYTADANWLRSASSKSACRLRNCGKRRRTTRLSPRELVPYGQCCVRMPITKKLPPSPGEAEWK